VRFIIKILGGAALLVAACQGPDEYFRGAFEDAGIDGPSLAGHGGTAGTGGHTSGAAGSPTGLGGMSTGLAGTTGNAGTTGSAGSPAGAAGDSGSAGTTGAAGTMNGRGGTTGAAGTPGRGGTTGAAGVAGTPGGGGTTGAAGSAGSAGTTGSGGGVTGRGGTTGAAGATGTGGSASGRGGTTGTAGTSGSAGIPGTVLYAEDFESDTVGSATANGWSRSGGSSGDWVIASDGTKVLEQNAATSSTVRVQSATGASGAPWSGAVSASARVKLLAAGGGSPAALLCVRFNDISNRTCAALVPNGVQIQTTVGGTAGQSAVFAATVTTGTFYDLRISVDASNLLTVYLGGAQRGTYMPGAMTNGTVAIGTASATAAFDSISVTRP
jgi:hypothetical protein